MKKLTSSEIISKLRLAGYRVQIRHDRAYREVWVDASSTCKVLELQLNSKGGTTVVSITNLEGDIFCGMADCRSDESYSKKMGVSVALGRAIKSMGFRRSVVYHLPSVSAIRKLHQASGLGRLSVLDTYELDTIDQVNPDAAKSVPLQNPCPAARVERIVRFPAIDCDLTASSSAIEDLDETANHLENMRIREELHDTILLSQEIVPEDISRYPSDHVTIVPLGFGIPEQQDHETQFVEDDLSTYLM